MNTLRGRLRGPATAMPSDMALDKALYQSVRGKHRRQTVLLVPHKFHEVLHCKNSLCVAGNPARSEASRWTRNTNAAKGILNP